MADIRILLTWLGLLSGCSSADGGAIECSPNDRDGTYRITYTEHPSGTCGSIPTSTQRIHPSDMIADNCAFTRPDEWSDDGCTLERSYACEVDGTTVTLEGITTQRTSSGSVIEGSVGVQQDAPFCFSTYDIRAVRQ